MTHAKDTKPRIRFNHVATEYFFEGFNPLNDQRVIIRSLDGNIVGTVDRNCCHPTHGTWEDLTGAQGKN